MGGEGEVVPSGSVLPISIILSTFAIFPSTLTQTFIPQLIPSEEAAQRDNISPIIPGDRFSRLRTTAREQRKRKMDLDMSRSNMTQL